MYVITGITGKVGGAAARHLLADGASIRAVVRSIEKAEPWSAKGCSVAVADMNDAASLSEAFAGAKGVFILIPPLFDPSEDFSEIRAILAALRQALEAARPAKVVCLSTVGAQASEPNLLNQLGLMEQSLGTLGLPIAFLRAAWFMENFAFDVASARDEGILNSFLQPLDHAIEMVATDDIGREVARFLGETWDGTRIVELAGPAAISANDVADTFATVLGRPVSARVLPRDTWEGMFRAAGMKNPTPRIQMLDGFNQGWIAFEGNGVEQSRGSTPLETVLRRLCGVDGAKD